ncbi:MAG: hypothetical protein C4320_03380 [Armatimonadota bacterium]
MARRLAMSARYGIMQGVGEIGVMKAGKVRDVIRYMAVSIFGDQVSRITMRHRFPLDRCNVGDRLHIDLMAINESVPNGLGRRVCVLNMVALAGEKGCHVLLTNVAEKPIVSSLFGCRC